MGKIGNTLATLKILETGRKYSVNQLAEILEVSPRMIKRYKEELEKSGIYIDTIKGIYGGYVYNQKNNYDITFSIKDVNTIEKALPFLEKNIKNDIEILLEKIKTIVIYSENPSINNNNKIEQDKKYKIISKAIKEENKLIITYKNIEKVIIPHNISFYKDNIYFTGYSENDKDLRTYNLNEIKFK